VQIFFFLQVQFAYWRFFVNKKKQHLAAFLSTSVMPMMFLELRSTEITSLKFTSTELFPAEFAFAELPEACLLAQIDHLTAPLATHELLLHPYRFALARCTFPYFARTHVHYQHGSNRQC
jgi:hypothetical protein